MLSNTRLHRLMMNMFKRVKGKNTEERKNHSHVAYAPPKIDSIGIHDIGRDKNTHRNEEILKGK